MKFDAIFEEAEQAIHTENYEQAFFFLKQIIKKSKFDPRANRLLGIVCMQTNKFGEAIEYFNASLFLEPNNLDSYLYRGQCYLESKIFVAAVLDFNKVVSIYSNVRLNLAYALHQIGATAEAIEIYNSILLETPDNVNALHNRGIVQLSQGNIAQARNDFEAALSINPEDALSSEGLQRCEFQENQNEQLSPARIMQERAVRENTRAKRKYPDVYQTTTSENSVCGSDLPAQTKPTAQIITLTC